MYKGRKPKYTKIISFQYHGQKVTYECNILTGEYLVSIFQSNFSLESYIEFILDPKILDQDLGVENHIKKIIREIEKSRENKYKKLYSEHFNIPIENVTADQEFFSKYFLETILKEDTMQE